MRLGGRVFTTGGTPAEWVAAHKHLGYTAAYCPLEADASDAEVRAWAAAAAAADLVIAEVGAWSNPISPDEATRLAAITHCEQQLALADRVGARCCVNTAGSRGPKRSGPHPDNLSDSTFDLIVETVRGILDAVKPTRTYYVLETMPWVFPDSADSYLRLIGAIDRDRFAVHLDPVNLVSSPQRFFNNAALIRECFEKLGARVRSCHAKDIALSGKLTVHLDEVRAGLGELDYGAYLAELDKLDPDTPLMVEHLPNAEEYALAADYIRSVAKKTGITIR